MDPLLQFLLTLFSSLFALLVCICFQYLRSQIIREKKTCTAPQAGGAWPIIGHMHLLGGRQLTHKTLGAMADKYGPVFTIRLGSHRVLVLNSWEMARECFTVHDKVFSTRPSIAASKLLGYDYAMFGFAPYGSYWREMRKIATIELLSNHRLDMLKHIRASEVGTAIKELYQFWVSKGSAESGVLVDMKQWFGDLTQNLALRIVGGKRYFGTNADFDEDEARRFQKVMREFVHLFGVFVLSDAIPLLGWLDLNRYEKRMKRTAKQLDALVGGWLEEHKQKKLSDGKRREEQDFMDVMLNTLEDAQISGFDADTINKATSLAMFRAIGFGYSRSLPSAAALNWVLKDGLGRLSRCIYTASLASAFDTNLKRVRLSTSVIFTLSIGVELLTPAFPQYFLLLASVANIAKQISLASYLATNTAVHRSFAIGDNLGEVSAKAQIQTVCFDNLGLLLAALLNMLLKNSPRLLAGLPFVIYPIFSAFDLFGIYQGLKHVHLPTLTKDRLEIILNTWIELGYVPSPADVSKEEGVDFLWTKGKNVWPIRIGCLSPEDQIPKWSMMAMQCTSSEDYYFICMEIFHNKVKRTKRQGILLCLREGAITTNIIMGFLQACYIRKAILVKRSWWENIIGGSDPLDSVFNEWFQVMEDSKRCAQKDLSLLNEQMLGMGWAAKNILLSTQEQARYSFVDD